MKSALYSLITSNDFNKSIQRLEQSYKLLKDRDNVASTKNQTTDERRENADIIAVIIMNLFLQSNQIEKFVLEKFWGTWPGG